MNTERLADWLRPLMPGKIAMWLRARDMADAPLRQLVDQQIAATAYRVFGDPRKRMILSLPPEKVVHKPIRLGVVQYDRPRSMFGLSKDQLLQHLAIFGRSGAGKTNITLSLFRQLIERNVPVLFFDWKRNAREILPLVTKSIDVYTAGRSLRPLPFNPFLAPPGIESHVYTQHVVDVLSDAFTLGDGSRRLIQKAITLATERQGSPPDPQMILQELEQLPEPRGQRAVKGWKGTAARVLEEMEFSQLMGGDATAQQRFARRLTKGITIIELDGLSQATRRFLVPLLFSWVYQVMLASSVRERLSLVVVLEEAHNVLYKGVRSTESLTESLLRQCREVGIGVILVDQQPNQIAPTVLGNVHTSICMNLKDPSDLSRAAGLSLLSDDEKTYLTRLEIGQGIVKLQTCWPRPFLVNFDYLPVAKGTVMDEALVRLCRGNLTQSTLRQGIFPMKGRGSRSRLADAGFKGMEDQVLDLIHDILCHPEDGVKKRYQRIGISTGRGNRLKQDLLTLGWLSQSVVPVGNSRRVVLKLTQDGKRVFGVGPDPVPESTGKSVAGKTGYIDVAAVIDLLDREDSRESLEHAYWKKRYADRLRELGYEVVVEARLESGYVDLFATGSDGQQFIEIETGKSNYLANTRRALREKGSRLTLVATTEAAMKTIERRLALENLLIPERVRIVLKDRCSWFEGN